MTKDYLFDLFRNRLKDAFTFTGLVKSDGKWSTKVSSSPKIDRVKIPITTISFYDEGDKIKIDFK